MSARKCALALLAEWATAADRLPPDAAPLEAIDPSAIAAWWAIRHPRTGVLFGWHADRDRLIRLYWQALDEDQRLELVAEAVCRIKDTEHRFAWKCAWSHWATGFGACVRAADRVATAWTRRDREALERALAGLAAALYPDPTREPPTPSPDATDLEDLSLDLATTALVQGDDQLARLIYAYGALAGRDRSQLPALLAAAAAAVDRLDTKIVTDEP